MDAVAITPCDVEYLRQNRLLMIHCLDLSDRFQVKVKSFPVLALNCIYGHISFLSELAERRVVVFPDGVDTHTKFKDVKSPCYIEVKSSAVFEVWSFLRHNSYWLPSGCFCFDVSMIFSVRDRSKRFWHFASSCLKVARDETEDGEEAQIAVIWDFEKINDFCFLDDNIPLPSEDKTVHELYFSTQTLTEIAPKLSIFKFKIFGKNEESIGVNLVLGKLRSSNDLICIKSTYWLCFVTDICISNTVWIFMHNSHGWEATDKHWILHVTGLFPS